MSTDTSDSTALPEFLGAIFQYLEVTLPSKVKQSAIESELALGLSGMGYDHSLGDTIREVINDTFRLQHWGCPIREALAPYRLYFRDHMAHALGNAYCLHKRGQNPVDALTADYAINYGGILSWATFEDATEQHRDRIIAEFQRFFQSGDELVRYSLPTSLGYFLVRGDRMVWEYETLHMCIERVPESWTRRHEEFKARGGYPAFFANPPKREPMPQIRL